MSDPQKTAEIVRKMQDILKSVANIDSNVSRLERDKNDKINEYDQKINRGRDEINRLEREKSEKIKDHDQKINREKDDIKRLYKQIEDFVKQL